MSATVKRGDRFVDRSGIWPQFVQITRVARDGSWADIRWCNWACATSGRMRLPLPDSAVRHDWTLAEVEASGPSDAPAEPAAPTHESESDDDGGNEG